MKRAIAPLLRTSRDVRIFKLGGLMLVVGCDSAGAVGKKRLDKIKVDSGTVGKFTARVALMEVLATGAQPICLSCTLSVEPKPTGAKIIKGITNELKELGFPKLPILESTEKNFPVLQTGLGVTALGLTNSRSLKIARCKRGDLLVALGIPQVGLEVMRGERERKVADARDVLILMRLAFVHEVIPVGSRGILQEARTLARDSKLTFRAYRNLKLDLKKSAGPGTVILCALQEQDLSRLATCIDKPLNPVGTLR